MFNTNDELRRQIQLGEDSLLECKQIFFRQDKVDGPGAEKMADEISAMSNAAGGVMVLGVEDKTRDIVGIDAARLDVPLIFALSERLSGKRPLYRLLDGDELQLTIFAASLGDD